MPSYPGYVFSGKWDKSNETITAELVDKGSKDLITITAQYTAKDGFYTVSGKKYYYKAGKKLTGWQTISNVSNV